MRLFPFGCWVGIATCLVACSVDKTVPPTTLIRCSTEGGCPSQFYCLRDAERCVHETAQCVVVEEGWAIPADDGASCAANAGLPGVCNRGLCEVSVCGDGIVDTLMGEQCDDANDDEQDGCTTFCMYPFCGDGVVFGAWERCDGNEFPFGSCNRKCWAMCDDDRGDCNADMSDGCECRPSVVTLLDGSLDAITMDTANIYWATYTGIVGWVGKSGFPSGVLETLQGDPSALAVDATHLYVAMDSCSWCSPTYLGLVERIALDGSEVVVLASGQEHVTALGLVGDDLIWTGDWGLWRMSKTGTFPADATLLADVGLTGDLLVEGSWVYITLPYSNEVVRVPVDGGVVELIASDQIGANGLASDGVSLFWTVRGEMSVISPERDGRVMRKRLASGAPQVLIDDVVDPATPAVDGNYLYWTDASEEQLWMVRKSGGPRILLNPGALGVRCVVADGDRVYYGTVDELRSLPVP